MINCSSFLSSSFHWKKLCPKHQSISKTTEAWAEWLLSRNLSVMKPSKLEIASCLPFTLENMFINSAMNHCCLYAKSAIQGYVVIFHCHCRLSLLFTSESQPTPAEQNAWPPSRLPKSDYGVLWGQVWLVYTTWRVNFSWRQPCCSVLIGVLWRCVSLRHQQTRGGEQGVLKWCRAQQS